MRSFPPVSYLAGHLPPSRLSRYFLACYLLIILLLSFYPFSGWHYNGEPVLAFYRYPLPYYFTFFDNFANVLAYVPLGLALVLSWRRRWYAWPLAVLSGTGLSAAVEFAQQFLPDRVASNLDILANGCGAVIGATLGLVVGSRRWQRRWLVLRHHFLAPGALGEWSLAWLGLWYVTQLDPSVPFLGVVVEAVALPQPFISPLSDARLFLDLLESSGVALHLIGVALFVSILVRYQRQVVPAMTLALGIGLLIKLFFAGVMLKRAEFFAWINLNVLIGAGGGIVVLAACARLNRRLRALLGALASAAALGVSWAWPLAAQLSATLALFRWQYGHLQHFSGMAALIGDLWPYGAIVLMVAVAATRSEA
ncbi:VanZ family protein [Chitiniphilus purpureus]|uniref:VanZ family protein n=1 Tax=Chitiniphilus purpureus TaxID=2981137 RepID=A0ABY6DLC2_9NEIS|nr:VanZ family protein [Chitiniphilus sp. CD1]UXY15157.1 VanZ family protein [Chitiniphilus sp. CD1]